MDDGDLYVQSRPCRGPQLARRGHADTRPGSLRHGLPCGTSVRIWTTRARRCSFVSPVAIVICCGASSVTRTFPFCILARARYWREVSTASFGGYTICTRFVMAVLGFVAIASTAMRWST